LGTDSFEKKRPRFEIGDEVTVVGPGPNKHKQGAVAKIVQGFDSIYRYDVIFSDGTQARYFGFELAYRQELRKSA
jgi:hypothetical protein